MVDLCSWNLFLVSFGFLLFFIVVTESLEKLTAQPITSISKPTSQLDCYITAIRIWVGDEESSRDFQMRVFVTKLPTAYLTSLKSLWSLLLQILALSRKLRSIVFVVAATCINEILLNEFVQFLLQMFSFASCNRQTRKFIQKILVNLSSL